MEKFQTPLIIIALVIAVFAIDYWQTNDGGYEPTVLDNALDECADFLQQNLSDYSPREDDYKLHDDLFNCVNEYMFNNQ